MGSKIAFKYGYTFMLIIVIQFLLANLLISNVNGTCDPLGSTPNNVTFTIKLDPFPEEVSWTIKSGGFTYLSGNGLSEIDYAVVTQSDCIADGCYVLSVNDSWGDGIYDDTYNGWFTLSLNDEMITLGEQTLDGYSSVVRFCTDLFNSAAPKTPFTFETYNLDFDLRIDDTSTITNLYDYQLNTYEFPDYFTSTQTNTLWIAPGCYEIYVSNIVHHFTNANLSITVDGTSITSTSYTYICTAATPTGQPTLPQPSTNPTTPTLAPTRIDYVFNVGVNSTSDSRDIDTRQFGCTSAGCSVSKIWSIEGACFNPRLTINIIETDYASDGIEEAYIYINNNYINSCGDSLDEDCTYFWETCDNVHQYDLSSYIDAPMADSENLIEIELDCLADVNFCPYTVDSIDYYLYGEVNIICDLHPNVTTSPPTILPSNSPTAPQPTSSPTTPPPTSDPTSSPTRIDYVFNVGINSTDGITDTDTRRFGCTFAGCSVDKFWFVAGVCYNPTLTVQIMETDYASDGIEEAYIYINGNYINSCGDSLDQDCTYVWETCDNVNQYDLSSYIDAPMADSENIIQIELDCPSDVDICPYTVDSIDYYLYGEVNITCELHPNLTTMAPTSFPSSQPTMPTSAPTVDMSLIDYVFTIGENDSYTNVQEFGCETAGCSVSKRWFFDGECINPQLDISIYETDYASSTVEYVNIAVNLDFVYDACPALNEDCGTTFVNCNISDVVDLSSYTTGVNDDLQITLAITSDVNFCGYEYKNVTYYLWGRVEISCTNPNVPTTPPSLIPTREPTFVPTSPTAMPSTDPSFHPSSDPSSSPSHKPSIEPSNLPTSSPSVNPSGNPSHSPSNVPSKHPSSTPTSNPTVLPTPAPSNEPTTIPTSLPTAEPITEPTKAPILPTLSPSVFPSVDPTSEPTIEPSAATEEPSGVPSQGPSKMPSGIPSGTPSNMPSNVPSTSPSNIPSSAPFSAPSGIPSNMPTNIPSNPPLFESTIATPISTTSTSTIATTDSDESMTTTKTTLATTTTTTTTTSTTTIAESITSTASISTTSKVSTTEGIETDSPDTRRVTDGGFTISDVPDTVAKWALTTYGMIILGGVLLLCCLICCITCCCCKHFCKKEIQRHKKIQHRKQQLSASFNTSGQPRQLTDVASNSFGRATSVGSATNGVTGGTRVHGNEGPQFATTGSKHSDIQLAQVLSMSYGHNQRGQMEAANLSGSDGGMSPVSPVSPVSGASNGLGMGGLSSSDEDGVEPVYKE